MHTLVLSSSSTNFAYQLGRLSCLDLSNVKHVVGTSAGAIIGTLLAFGWTPEAMLREALEYPWWDTVARNLNFTFFLFSPFKKGEKVGGVLLDYDNQECCHAEI